MIASILNGPGEKLNIVPMDSNLNRGAWKQLENSWADALNAGKQVKVSIEPQYQGDSRRPEGFNITYVVAMVDRRSSILGIRLEKGNGQPRC
ncbi:MULTISPECIES: DNA/RNA non-specific endonuclease [Burkholderia]|uniref:DNA/RNA non-specific endonuclease n=1 Tax=Burkholderia TaxID=32008 RepID=UPI003592EC51